MAFEFNQIAAGHNNQAGLTRWSKLQVTPCELFQGYKKFIPMEWNTHETQEQAGNRLYVKIGLPNFAFVFPLITPEEDVFLRDTFTTNSISGYVTITVEDQEDLTWKDFNATMVILPDNKNFNIESGEFEGYRVEFYDLEAL